MGIKEKISVLEEYINNGDIDSINEFVLEYNIVDLAEIINELDVIHIVYLFKVLDKVLLGDLFSYLSFNTQSRLKDLLTSKELSSVLDYVYTDDTVEFLEQLDRSDIRSILNYTSAERRDILNEMLSYPKDSAGSIMSTDYVEIGQYITVEDATEVIKTHADTAEVMNVFYITDINGVLEGVVSIREILFAPLNKTIEDIMTKEVIMVNTLDHQEDVAKVISKYDLSSVPVVDHRNVFVGLISADDIIDVVEDEATEDILKMGGITSLGGMYLETPAIDIAKNRIIWLLILAVTYVVTSFIIIGYSDLIMKLPSLILFIPLLMDVGGDAGSQALVMVVRGIAVDGIDSSSFKKIFLKELGISLIVGSLLFIGNMVRIMYFSVNTGDFYLALTVSLALFIVVILSKIIGGLLPLVALLFKKDPTVMASPLITTLSDSIALLVYFSVATLFLGRLLS